MSEAEASKRGITPMARIVSWATAGVDPQIMGTGPIPASRKALEKAGWKRRRSRSGGGQRGLRRAGLRGQQGHGLGSDIVNVNGGAIAIGHPVGASVRAHSQHAAVRNARRDAKKGLATLCIGGGMGVALCVERG
jgi:acetyl-CoA C-acetyltransferase